MSNDPFKWSTPPRGGAPVNSPCIEHDNVNHPAHYTAGGVECIDAIAAALTCQKDPMQAWLDGTGAQVHVALAAKKRQGRSAKGEILS